jgi:hypothetical protein
MKFDHIGAPTNDRLDGEIDAPFAAICSEGPAGHALKRWTFSGITRAIRRVTSSGSGGGSSFR